MRKSAAGDEPAAENSLRKCQDVLFIVGQRGSKVLGLVFQVRNHNNATSRASPQAGPVLITRYSDRRFQVAPLIILRQYKKPRKADKNSFCNGLSASTQGGQLRRPVSAGGGIALVIQTGLGNLGIVRFAQFRIGLQRAGKIPLVVAITAVIMENCSLRGFGQASNWAIAARVSATCSEHGSNESALCFPGTFMLGYRCKKIFSWGSADRKNFTSARRIQIMLLRIRDILDFLLSTTTTGINKAEQPAKKPAACQISS